MALSSCVPGASAGPSLHRIQLPFSQSGVLVEHSSNYLKVVARLGLVFMWNQDDSLLVSLGPEGVGHLQLDSVPTEGRKCSGHRQVGGSEPPSVGEDGGHSLLGLSVSWRVTWGGRVQSPGLLCGAPRPSLGMSGCYTSSSVLSNLGIPGAPGI